MRLASVATVLITAMAAAGCGGSSKPTADSHVFTVPAKLPPRAGTTTADATATTPASTTSTDSGTVSSPSPASTGPPEPHIVREYIPFGAKRKAEMAAYALRHYGFSDYHLRNPRVIVEHYTETTTFSAAFNTFAPDVPDSELHELPGTCAQFVIDRDGMIYQLVPLSIMCRHTVGLNWTAIGIEHVGMSDQDVMGDKAELDASLKLTTWLRCRLHVAVKNVIGHNESLGSPYHQENVPALRTQTHADMQPPTMQTYRADLPPCGD